MTSSSYPFPVLPPSELPSCDLMDMQPDDTSIFSDESDPMDASSSSASSHSTAFFSSLSEPHGAPTVYAPYDDEGLGFLTCKWTAESMDRKDEQLALIMALRLKKSKRWPNGKEKSFDAATNSSMIDHPPPASIHSMATRSHRSYTVVPAANRLQDMSVSPSRAVTAVQLRPSERPPQSGTTPIAKLHHQEMGCVAQFLGLNDMINMTRVSNPWHYVISKPVFVPAMNFDARVDYWNISHWRPRRKLLLIPNAVKDHNLLERRASNLTRHIESLRIQYGPVEDPKDADAYQFMPYLFQRSTPRKILRRLTKLLHLRGLLIRVDPFLRFKDASASGLAPLFPPKLRNLHISLLMPPMFGLQAASHAFQSYRSIVSEEEAGTVGSFELAPTDSIVEFDGISIKEMDKHTALDAMAWTSIDYVSVAKIWLSHVAILENLVVLEIDLTSSYFYDHLLEEDDYPIANSVFAPLLGKISLQRLVIFTPSTEQRKGTISAIGELCMSCPNIYEVEWKFENEQKYFNNRSMTRFMLPKNIRNKGSRQAMNENVFAAEDAHEEAYHARAYAFERNEVELADGDSTDASRGLCAQKLKQAMIRHDLLNANVDAAIAIRNSCPKLSTLRMMKIPHVCILEEGDLFPSYYPNIIHMCCARIVHPPSLVGWMYSLEFLDFHLDQSIHLDEHVEAAERRFAATCSGVAQCTRLENLFIHCDIDDIYGPIEYFEKSKHLTAMLKPLVRLRGIGIDNIDRLDSIKFLTDSGANTRLANLLITGNRLHASYTNFLEFDALVMPELEKLWMCSIFIEKKANFVDSMTRNHEDFRIAQFPKLCDVNPERWW